MPQAYEMTNPTAGTAVPPGKVTSPFSYGGLAAILRKHMSLVIFALTVAGVGTITHGGFFTARNLTNLTRQISLNGILSIGMTYVILTGGIDLSVGSVVALAGVVAGYVQVNMGYADHGVYGALFAIAASMGVGLLAGLFNGLFIVRSKVVPFIITLGLMVIARGLALILANGAAIAPLGDSFNFIGQGYLSRELSLFVVAGVSLLGLARAITSRHILTGALSILGGAVFTYMVLGYRGIPVPVAIFGALALVAHFILQNTVHGRYVIATGSNPDAAFLSGVPIQRVTTAVYVLMGALSGLSGAVLSARLNGAMPTAGDLFELDAIAAVVIGGTRLTGGVGTIAGSVLGAFLIGVLNNGMSLLNMTEFYQKVIKGVIIIAAVWIDTKSRGGRK